MGIVDIGTVVQLNGGEPAVIIGIIRGASLGIFYTVLVGSEVREINESQITAVISQTSEGG